MAVADRQFVVRLSLGTAQVHLQPLYPDTVMRAEQHARVYHRDPALHLSACSYLQLRSKLAAANVPGAPGNCVEGSMRFVCQQESTRSVHQQQQKTTRKLKPDLTGLIQKL